MIPKRNRFHSVTSFNCRLPFFLKRKACSDIALAGYWNIRAYRHARLQARFIFSLFLVVGHLFPVFLFITSPLSVQDLYLRWISDSSLDLLTLGPGPLLSWPSIGTTQLLSHMRPCHLLPENWWIHRWKHGQRSPSLKDQACFTHLILTMIIFLTRGAITNCCGPTIMVLWLAPIDWGLVRRLIGNDHWRKLRGFHVPYTWGFL